MEKKKNHIKIYALLSFVLFVCIWTILYIEAIWITYSIMGFDIQIFFDLSIAGVMVYSLLSIGIYMTTQLNKQNRLKIP
jgi:uncharacterized membrane protein